MASTTLIDSQKAFDTIDHSILLQKLYPTGFSKVSVNQFQSYFINRTFLATTRIYSWLSTLSLSFSVSLCSLTDTSPTDTSPTGQFPDQCFPDLTFPRPDISPSGYFPNWTFIRLDISPTRHFPKRIFTRLHISASRHF